MNNKLSITGVTPTICSLLGIEYNGKAIPFKPLLDRAKKLSITSVQKVLIYAPDAIGSHLYNKYTSSFGIIKKNAGLCLNIQSIYPSFTPVCFASMFTGVKPVEHGIQKYEKPIIKIETLFDLLISNGKKVAIAAVENSSIDMIFRERQLDYFTEKYDPEVTERVIALLEKDEHDLILAYHQEYDDSLHESGPFSKKSIKAMENHLDSFERLSNEFNRCWEEYDRLLAFTPDHGAHVDKQTGKGSHGLDIPEDMDLKHFYDIFSGKN